MRRRVDAVGWIVFGGMMSLSVVVRIEGTEAQNNVSSSSCAPYADLENDNFTCPTIFNGTHRLHTEPVHSNCTTNCDANTCCEVRSIMATCGGYAAPGTCWLLSNAETRECPLGCDEDTCCLDPARSFGSLVVSASNRRCGNAHISLGPFTSAKSCAIAAAYDSRCFDFIDYVHEGVRKCRCCDSSESETNHVGQVDPSANVYKFSRRLSCDATQVARQSLHVGLGNCTQQLAIGATCSLDCGSNVDNATTQQRRVVSVSSICNAGTPPRLISGYCFQDFDTTLGVAEEGPQFCPTGTDVPTSSSFPSYPATEHVVAVPFSLLDDNRTLCTSSSHEFLPSFCANGLQVVKIRLHVRDDITFGNQFFSFPSDLELNLSIAGATHIVDGDNSSVSIHLPNCSDMDVAVADLSTRIDLQNRNFVEIDVTDHVARAIVANASSNGSFVVLMRYETPLKSRTGGKALLRNNETELLVEWRSDQAELAECLRRHGGMFSLSTCESIQTCVNALCDELFLDGLDLSNSFLTDLLRNVRHLPALNLANNPLAQIPNFTSDVLWTNLTRLDMSGTSLVRIDSGAFDTLESLTDLELGSNAIAHVAVDALRGLKSLKRLNLRDNRIASLPQDLFEDGSKLEILILDSNAIAELPEGLLSFETVPSIREIDLGTNRLGGQLEAGDIIRRGRGSKSDGGGPPLAALEVLILSFNEIEAIGANAFGEDAPNLVSLWLNDNRIAELAPSSFSGLSRLEELMLFGNQIEELPTRVFGSLHSLQRIVLSSNRIHTIHPFILSGVSLDRFDLSDQRISVVYPDAFNGSYVRQLKLNKNNIRTISASAFDGWTHRSGAEASSTQCEDLSDWDVVVADDRVNCSGFASLGPLLRGVNMNTPGSAGFTPAEACCAFGGGNLHGTTLIIDSHSHVTCMLDGDSGHSVIVCKCGSSGGNFRFDFNASTCLPSCALGEYWSPSTSPSIASGQEAGQCLPCAVGSRGIIDVSSWPETCDACESGRFASREGSDVCDPCGKNEHSANGASSCESCSYGKTSDAGSTVGCVSCSWSYIGSRHCDFPALAVFLGVGSVVLCAVIAYQCRVVHRRLTHNLAQSKQMLKTTLDDVELMSAAWRFDSDEIRLVRKLAAGGAGEVWLGNLHNKWEVAVKKVFFSDEVDLNDDSEIKFLQRCRHPRLVMFVGCGRGTDGNVFLVLEMMDGGSLDRRLWKDRFPSCSTPSEIDLAQILLDTAEGMRHLHTTLRSVHRDLKSPNILLQFDTENETKRLRGKVADFGLSRVLDTASLHAAAKEARLRSKTWYDDESDIDDDDAIDTSSTAIDADEVSTKTFSTDESLHLSRSMTGKIGTIPWMAPELFSSNEAATHLEYSQTVDVYAFGVILYEASALSSPWRGTSSDVIKESVMKGQRPSHRSAASKNGEGCGGPSSPARRPFVSLMKSCWAQRPADRPSFGTIVAKLQDIMVDLHRRTERAAEAGIPATPSTTGMSLELPPAHNL